MEKRPGRRKVSGWTSETWEMLDKVKVIIDVKLRKNWIWKLSEKYSKEWKKNELAEANKKAQDTRIFKFRQAQELHHCGTSLYIFHSHLVLCWNLSTSRIHLKLPSDPPPNFFFDHGPLGGLPTSPEREGRRHLGRFTRPARCQWFSCSQPWS